MRKQSHEQKGSQTTEVRENSPNIFSNDLGSGFGEVDIDEI